MKFIEQNTVELTDAERVVLDWHNSLLDTGYSTHAAVEQILLRTPTDGATWKLLEDDDFRRYLAGVRMWGPLAKDDHKAMDEPLPRVEFLDDEGTPMYEAVVRRLGPDLYVVKSPASDMEHLMTTQEIKDDDYVRFVPCGRVLVLGGSDPSGTECDLNIDHTGKHEGDDPLGSEQRVRWEGGGGLAGDRLPTRNIEYIDPK